MTTTSPLPIDVISDVVCPWCYIGKRRLEQAIALKPEIPVEVHFRPYFLNPWVPRAGMKQRLMALYFSEGGDLTDREVLVKAAADCGLDPARVRELLASDQDVEQVTAEANSAKDAGIDGVPCFVFGGLLAVSGAQAPEHLAQAIERAAAELGRRVA